MKWIFKLMLVMTLAFSGSVYAERTPMEVAAEARVSSEPVDTTDLVKFSIPQRDFYMNGFNGAICGPCLQLPLPKMLANHLLYNPDLAQNSGGLLGVLVESLYLRIGGAIGYGFAILWLFNLWWTASKNSKYNDKESAAIKAAIKEQHLKNFKLTLLVLGVGLLIQPEIFLTVITVAVLLIIAILNWASLTFTVAIAEHAPDITTVVADVQPKLTQYNTSEQIGIWNGIAETVTKTAIIASHNNQLGRSGFFSSGLTKKDVVNDIENNVKLNMVPVIRNGIVEQINMVWNEKFDNYDAAKYGRASILFPIRATNLDSSIEQEADTDLTNEVRLIAQADGQKIFSADDFYSKLNQYESAALSLVADGKFVEAQSFYDTDIVLKVADGLDSGLGRIKQKYLSEGLGSDTNAKVYKIYSATFLNSAQGLNPALTWKGKWKYMQEASNHPLKYNCSNFYDKQIDDIHINGFNILSGGTPWLDAGRIAATLPTQCVTFKGGVAMYMGVDAKTDEANVLLYKDRTTASGIAVSNLTSNIIEGALLGQLKFMQANNPYKNALYSNIDLGFIHAGVSATAIGKALNNSARMGDSVRNGLVVDYAAGGDYSVGVDFNKLFGDERETKDLANNEGYKQITTDYKPLIFDSLINPAKAGSSTTYQQAQNFNEEGESFSDTLINIMQSNSALFSNFKGDLGLSQDKTISRGIVECNAMALACDNRGTATVSSIYRSDPLMLGVYIKMGTTAVAAVKQFDIGSIINKFGISGDSWIGKQLGKASAVLSKFAFLFQMAMAALDVLLVPLDLLANIFIMIGLWALALQILPAIQMIMVAALSLLLVVEMVLVIYLAILQAIYKRDPRYALTGLKQIFGSWLGVLFYLIGHYIMLTFIYYLSFTSVSRAIYTSVAGEGGVFGMLAGIVVVLFTYAFLHTLFLTIPRLTMSMKNVIVGSDSNILDEAAANRTLETLAVTYLGERAAVGSMEAMKEKAVGTVKQLSGKPTAPATPPTDAKPPTNTEGR